MAADEARLLEGAGFDGVMIQNTHGRPARVSLPAGSTPALTAVTAAVREAVSFNVGVNAHKNDDGRSAGSSAGGAEARAVVRPLANGPRVDAAAGTWR